MKINEYLLVVEHSNFVTKTVNAYIVFKLDIWPKNLSDNRLFGTTNIVKKYW